MHKEPETLGEILKTARMRADITMETLAERVDITEPIPCPKSAFWFGGFLCAGLPPTLRC